MTQFNSLIALVAGLTVAGCTIAPRPGDQLPQNTGTYNKSDLGASGDAQARESEIARAGDLIVSDLRAYIHPLNEPLKVYHYWDQGDTHEILKTTDQASPVVQREVGAFFDLQASAKSFSPGYYAALDPYVTSSFGGRNFGMLMTELPPDMKVLYLSKMNSWTNSKIPAALAAMKATDCSSQAMNNSPMETLIRNASCRPLAIYVIRQLMKDGLAGIHYESVATKVDHCANPISGQAAIIVLEPRYVMAHSKVFGREIPKGDLNLKDRQAIAEIERRGMVSLPQGMRLAALWPTLITAKNFDVDSWMGNNLVNCENLKK